MGRTPHHSLRVLVVDDNRDTAQSLAFLFQMWGHEVRVVYDGRAALEAARDFQPAAIVLDIGLPQMDGFEVAQHLRQLPETTGAFIVGSSGYSQEKDRQRAVEVGIDLYLVKPFDPWQLEETLASLPAVEAVPA